MKKGVIIGIIIVLWGAVLIAAYNYFTVKGTQQAIQKDDQRLFDISVNDYYVARYYTEHNQLPASLTDIIAAYGKNENTNIVPPVLQDPDKKDYSYQAVSDDTYKICTTFATDTLHNKNLSDDYSAYIATQLERYAKSVYHKSGYDCIELSMRGNPQDQANVDVSNMEPFTFLAPANGEKICLGQDYRLAWEGDENTTQVSIYLIPPNSLHLSESWIQNGYVVSPGEVVEMATSRILEGSLIWKVGALETPTGKTEPEPVIPSDGYQLGVVTTIAGIQRTSTSDFFEIANCSGVSN